MTAHHIKILEEKNLLGKLHASVVHGRMFNPCSIKPTCAHVSQNNVQSAAVIVQVPGLVVAVSPFTLHQERPRHVFGAA